MTTVRMMVPARIARSPPTRSATIVASDAAATFTAVLPSRIKPMSRSGRCSNHSVRRAPRWPARA